MTKVSTSIKSSWRYIIIVFADKQNHPWEGCQPCGFFFAFMAQKHEAKSDLVYLQEFILAVQRSSCFMQSSSGTGSCRVYGKCGLNLEKHKQWKYHWYLSQARSLLFTKSINWNQFPHNHKFEVDLCKHSEQSLLQNCKYVSRLPHVREGNSHLLYTENQLITIALRYRRLSQLYIPQICSQMFSHPLSLEQRLRWGKTPPKNPL